MWRLRLTDLLGLWPKRKETTMSNETMAYVAADPAQPGAAWAAYVDDSKDTPSMKKDLAKEIASWVRKGATVQRVPVQQARDMLAAWKRPEKKGKPASEQTGLF